MLFGIISWCENWCFGITVKTIITTFKRNIHQADKVLKVREEILNCILKFWAIKIPFKGLCKKYKSACNLHDARLLILNNGQLDKEKSNQNFRQLCNNGAAPLAEGYRGTGFYYSYFE